MHHWLILGAGSGTGALVAERLRADNQPVVALVRRPEATQRLRVLGVQVVEGDARQPQTVQQACRLAGADATVISTLGGQEEDLAHRTVIDNTEQSGITRMLLVTSLGCGNSWPWLSARAKTAFGRAVRLKSLAECWLRTSTLDYLILRPGGLTDGPATGQAERLPASEEVHGLVSRRDLAEMIIQCGQLPALDNAIYSVVDRSLTVN